MTLNGLYQSGTAPQAGQQIGGAVAGAMGGGQAPAAGGGFWGALRPQIQQLVAQQPPMNPWQQAQQKLGVNQPNPNPQPGDLPWIDHTGQPPGPPVWTGGITGKGVDPRTLPFPLPQSGSGGTTRRGSQILDAQGNVIGHYDANNQPVYHGGQGAPGPLGPNGPNNGWGSEGPGGLSGHNQDPGFLDGFRRQMPQGPVASTSMGMAPSYARLGVPGSMQQALYGNGLLRPAMPSMNNQSGY